MKCYRCGALRAEADDDYMIASANIVGHSSDRETEPQRVAVTNVIVCSNKCLASLLSLKGF